MRPLLAALALLLAGCGGDERAPAAGGATTAGGRATGGGLSIAEALDRGGRGPVLVKGAVVAREGEIRLCSGFAESYPPQCAEPSLRVEGLALRSLEGRRNVRLERAQGVVWTAGEVELRGEVEGRVLRVRELPG